MDASLSTASSHAGYSRHPIVDGLFRGLFSLIFIVAGAGHLLDPESIALRLENAPMGYLATSLLPSTPMVIAAGVALLVGGLALLIGYRTRLSALLLMAVLVPITITVQIGAPTLGPLFKNIALFGGLLFFATNGGGAYSIDARQPRA
ncbi:hypothetical protein CRI94_15510 [Longibacter salinarum]|uniref:DoxX family protein n=1 Tax=Longibacter salinarum TaxID=1850348 RepID=A0A2A8CV69_9BACT|nr:DoxX family protein [Longibacter salinarum]PEN11441.1 hypothetical protein CRI94_15510 [Longibacter salinarum]